MVARRIGNALEQPVKQLEPVHRIIASKIILQKITLPLFTLGSGADNLYTSLAGASKFQVKGKQDEPIAKRHSSRFEEVRISANENHDLLLRQGVRASYQGFTCRWTSSPSSQRMGSGLTH